MASDIKLNCTLSSCLSVPCRLRSGPFKSASVVSKDRKGQMGEGWMTLEAVSLWFFFFSLLSFRPPPFVTNRCPNEAHQNTNSSLFYFVDSFHVLGLPAGLTIVNWPRLWSLVHAPLDDDGMFWIRIAWQYRRQEQIPLEMQGGDER